MQNAKRRSHVRSLLRQAKQAGSDEIAGTCAEMAGDILLTFLDKPFCAQIVYTYATTKLRNPERLLIAIDEMAWIFGSKQKLIDVTVESLTDGKPDMATFEGRVQSHLPRLIRDGDLRDAILSTLRSRERFDQIVLLLALCANAANILQRRPLLMALGHALRFGRGDLPAAADAFERLVADNPSDREAWGELLECLEDSGDDERLIESLTRRISITTGLEREQLSKFFDRVTGRRKDTKHN